MAKPKTLPYDAAEAEAPFSVTLHSQVGGSDKIYKLSISAKDGGWVVDYANGRRGSTLTSGTKTTIPVSYAEARRICNSQLYGKVGDGYVPIAGSRFGDGMQAEAIAAIARDSTGWVPQLLSPLDHEDAERFLRDPDYVMQQKFDGERRFAIVSAGAVTGSNRRGYLVALPSPIVRDLEALGRDFVVDGEQVGDVLHCYDLLSIGGTDLRQRSLSFRLRELGDLLDEVGPSVRMAPAAWDELSKRSFMDRVREKSGEGVVFKHTRAPYEPGKPGANASWFKLKFWNSLSAVVGEVNSKRSVALRLFDEAGAAVEVGNVTIPANAEIPKAGDVVEIRYLYAYDGGSLFQPAYLGVRGDIEAAECLASQRVFKPVDMEEDESPSMRM